MNAWAVCLYVPAVYITNLYASRLNQHMVCMVAVQNI